MRRIVSLSGGLLVVVLAGGAVFGSLRYGSVDGLYRRVHAEIASRQPHPLLAPTPLPVPVRGTPIAALTLSHSPAPAVRTVGATSRPVATPMPTPPSTAEPPPATTTLATAASPAPASPDPQPAPSETPQATLPPPVVPPAVQLSGLTHVWQTWNNCGPATLAMNLSHCGLKISQADVAATIRPNKEDKNVSPDELAAFAQAQGLHAIARVNGDPDRLRQLLASGIPVLVETWHEPKPNDGMGHYRLLTGYDDAAQVWIAYDSYDATGVDPKKPYAGIRIPYEQLDPLWTVFNRPYVVVHTDALAAQIETIIGEDSDDMAMWQRALSDAQNAVKHDPRDAFAWFNLGSDLTALGRYDEAVEAYDRARPIGLPWRMFWYQFGAFQAYYQVGRYDEVVALANTTLRTARYVEELYYWRGLAQLGQGKPAEARASFEKSLEMNQNYAQAADALAALPAP